MLAPILAVLLAQTSPVVDSTNSTTTTLGIGAVYTGTSRDVLNYSAIAVSSFSDVASAASGLSIQFSSNGTNWDITNAYTVAAGVATAITEQPKARFFRIVYTNGGTGQASFRLQTILHPTSIPGASGHTTIYDATDGTPAVVSTSSPAGTEAGLYVRVVSQPAAGANASTNVTQWNGNTVSTNSGTKSAGTLQVVLATDQPALTNKLLVTPDALPANQSVNTAQFGGTNVSTGVGAGGAGIPRVTVSNDSTVGLVAGSAVVGKVGIDQTTMGTTNGVVPMPTTVAGAALSQAVFTANTALNIKASAGNVYGWSAINAAAAVCWLQFYNTAGSPTCGTAVIWSVPLPVTPGVSNFVPASLPLQAHATGIAICVSTTATGATTCGSVASGTIFFK